MDIDLKVTITGTFLLLFIGIVFFYFELLPADGVMDLFIVPAFVLICFPFVKIVGFIKNQKEKSKTIHYEEHIAGSQDRTYLSNSGDYCLFGNLSCL
jgi:hypothetical protein